MALRRSSLPLAVPVSVQSQATSTKAFKFFLIQFQMWTFHVALTNASFSIDFGIRLEIVFDIIHDIIYDSDNCQSQWLGSSESQCILSTSIMMILRLVTDLPNASECLLPTQSLMEALISKVTLLVGIYDLVTGSGGQPEPASHGEPQTAVRFKFAIGPGVTVMIMISAYCQCWGNIIYM